MTSEFTYSATGPTPAPDGLDADARGSWPVLDADALAGLYKVVTMRNWRTDGCTLHACLDVGPCKV